MKTRFPLYTIMTLCLIFIVSCSDEKPTEPIDQSYGYIYIVTQPDSSEIFVNDISTLQYSPDTIKVSVGNKRILLKKNGYRDTTISVTVVKDEYLFRTIQLLPGVSGNIYLNSNPQGAKIFIDGINTNKITPEQILGLLPKSYEITLSKAGYYDTTFTANIISGETIVRSVNLKPGAVFNLYLTSSPEGAQIFLGTTNSGKVTPDTLKNITAGSVSITLKLNAYKDTTFTVTVESGNTTSKAVVLTPTPVLIETFNDIKLYEKASSNLAGLDLSTGTRVSATSPQADIFYDVTEIKSQHLRPGTIPRYTDFYNNVTSTNIEDGLDAPPYSSISGEWAYAKPTSQTTYSFLYTNDLNYVKLKITSTGGGTGPSDPYKWITVSYKYNKTTRDKRF